MNDGPAGQDGYDDCAETCNIDLGLDDSEKKLKTCIKRCFEDREECLDRYREGAKRNSAPR